MIYYFAYGSNMSEKRMIERGITIFYREPAMLLQYELIFNKLLKDGSGAANVVPSPGSIVEGKIYGILEDDIYKLDKYEGYPKHYDRKILTIKNKDCIIYIAQSDYIRENLKPTMEYLNFLLEGKEFLTSDYYNKLLTFKS